MPKVQMIRTSELQVKAMEIVTVIVIAQILIMNYLITQMKNIKG